jgi:signal recognition particle subunit SRP54
MFQTLTQNLSNIFNKLRGHGALTEEHIDLAMRDVRIALLEADVALNVAKDFINAVKERAKGQEVVRSVSPGQMVVKIFHDELVKILSSPEDEQKLDLKAAPPVNLMMIGLQGSGKTTSSAKLALRLKNQGKKCFLVSLDTYRPAAQEQLKILADAIEVDSLPIVQGEKPIAITKRALKEAKLGGYNVVIYDTAGRLHIDKEMIDELEDIKSLVTPNEILFVADSMTGQDAVQVAKNFHDVLGITGVILTRVDGDARGGAALSIKYVIGKPIKFLGVGEKTDALEEFHADRIASRILDMGDVISFVEHAASTISQEDAEKALKKMKSGQFGLIEYLDQLRSISKMGGIAKIMGMMPGMGGMMSKVDPSKMDGKMLSYQEAIILSMTAKERKNPDLLNASRRKRIAAGSGRSVQEVNKLMKQFMQIRDMMKKMGKMDQKSLLRSGIGKMFGG